MKKIKNLNDTLISTKELIIFKKYFIKSIKEKDKKTFLSFFRKNNDHFYNEQSHWFDNFHTDHLGEVHRIESINIKREYIKSIFKIEIIVRSTNKFNEIRSNKMLYRINKDQKGIFISGLDIDKYVILNGLPSIQFNENLKKIAPVLIECVQKSILLIQHVFKISLKMEDLNIVLFESVQELSCSVPTDRAYGWYEYQESIKISIPEFVKNSDINTYLMRIIVHEMTHFVLSKESNDNLSLLLQEGTALYLESLIEIEDNCDLIQVDKSLNILREFETTIKSFQKAHELSLGNDVEIYHQGYLWVNYLISVYGIEKFLVFIKSFGKLPFINLRMINKSTILNEVVCKEFQKNYEIDVFDAIKIRDYYDKGRQSSIDKQNFSSSSI